MAETPLDLPIVPGFNKTDTAFAATGRFVDGDRIRFINGKPENIGGWSKFFSGAFNGFIHGMLAWRQNPADVSPTWVPPGVAPGATQITNFVAGSASALEIIQDVGAGPVGSGGLPIIITPTRAVQAGLSNPFTTTSSSTAVNVQDVGHGAYQGDHVSYTGVSNPVNGITIGNSLDFPITSIVDIDNYIITPGDTATSSGSGGGTVQATYRLNSGLIDAAAGGDPRTWFLVQYGEDLIAGHNQGTLYHYDSSVSNVVGTAISNAPSSIEFVFLTPERFVFALGADERMTVSWPDQDDFTDWTPTAINTANSRQLAGGTRLMSGSGLTQGLSIVWSDAAAFLFQYNGLLSSVYSSRQISDKIGIIAPHAFTIKDGIAYWMSEKGLYLYNGNVQQIPNSLDIRDFVFEDITATQRYKIICEYRTLKNEIWWYYPTFSQDDADVKENNRYVMLSLDSMTWVTGTGNVTAVTKHPVTFRTLTADHSFFMQDNEESSDFDADGSELVKSLKSSLFQIADGQVAVDVWGFLPDFLTINGSWTLKIDTYNRPQSSATEGTATKTITSGASDEIIDFNISGRLLQFTLTSSGLGTEMRMGRPQILIDTAGVRRS